VAEAGQPRIEAGLARYRWRATLLASLALATVILSVQLPTIIYTPDVAFHAAKIQRATAGEFFIDPFTGSPTIYPSLFHVGFGLLNRVWPLDSLHLIRLIVVIDFLGLFAALYYLARAFFATAEAASLCVLAVPLVFSSPTGRYILLAQPSCFAYGFLIAGVGALYRYLRAPTPAALALGGGLLGLAANIWWTNLFVVAPIVAVLGGYALVRRPRPPLAHVALFVVALGLPGAFTAWELWSVRAILPDVAAPPGRPGFVDTLAIGVTTFLTKGNLQFMPVFSFWDLAGAPSTGGVSGAVRLLHSLASFVHYVVLVLPFNLLLVGYAVWMVVRTPRPPTPAGRLLWTLPWIGLLVLVGSLGTPDAAHMRRVHFIVYLVLLIFAAATLPAVVRSARVRRGLALGVCAASLVSLAYTVVYSSRLFASGLPSTDRAVVGFIQARPGHGDERIFMLGDSLRRVAPFVTFRSFVDMRQGVYYWQDPVTGGQLYRDFLVIQAQGPDWQAVLRARAIRLIILRISVPADRAVFERYRAHGVIRLQNADWVVLEVAT
jgi:hypothetical protein